MPRPYASGVVPAPVDKVWGQVRAFNDLPAFLPAIGHSEIVEGVDGQVGAVRRLTLADGGDPFDERLLVLDDPGRSYTYTFTGRYTGACEIGTSGIEAGTFRFPVQCLNTNVRIDLVNDSPMPSAFISAEWEGMRTSRSVAGP